MADYGMEKTLAGVSYEDALERVTAALKAEGFGILTEIDVQATLKKKLDVDMPRYTILGACNPGIAHKALGKEANIGLLLPCNVVLADDGQGGTRVAIASPSAMFEVTGRDDMGELVADAEGRLQRALDAM